MVSLILKLDSSNIKFHALLDSGASTCFMDKDFIDCHKLPLVTKKHPIPIEIIDGRHAVIGDITHKTIPLDIILEGYHNIIAFNVIKSFSNPNVLGLS
jgi:hypothetical protein